MKSIAKELMGQWQTPLAGRLPPRVRSLGAAPQTSRVSLGVSLSKIKRMQSISSADRSL